MISSPFHGPDFLTFAKWPRNIMIHYISLIVMLVQFIRRPPAFRSGRVCSTCNSRLQSAELQANFGTKVSCPGLRTLRRADFTFHWFFDRVPSKFAQKLSKPTKHQHFQSMLRSASIPTTPFWYWRIRVVFLLVCRGLALPFAHLPDVKRVAGR